ncbi:MAG: tetratricopeptide repeat protein, partial [Gammaproteobacteria bacterium]|nr:tetratricopeptide repeat protein [Gammaproteobacteria bacterium]
MKTPRNIAPLLWLIMFCAAGAAYLPGLQGGFILDDFANLSALGKYGSIDSAQDLWRYLTNGLGGPGGRPLALLSFLLDDNGWPAAAAAFKRTNLLIHLLNGVLLT